MYGRPKTKVRPARRHRYRAWGSGPEMLESRQLLATFTVTNTGDLDVLGLPVPNSLRDMINRANNNPGPDTIKFNIGGSSVQTIYVLKPLPAISDPLTTIDGLSERGSSDSAPPLIAINGTFAGPGADGLRAVGANESISGLIIDQFQGNGIELDSVGATVQNCYIGLDPTGTLAQGNLENGIYINNGQNNTIGGTSTVAGGTGNFISGNGGDGVLISFGQNNKIYGNQIGSNFGGDLAIPNAQNGVEIVDSPRNQVGAPDSNSATLGNFISGNTLDGVRISGNSLNTTVQGDFIGLTTTFGPLGLANGQNGVDVIDSNQTTIGGVAAGAFDIISANKGAGILIDGSSAAVIQGNLIGTDQTGGTDNVMLGNGGAGIEIRNGSALTVGGQAALQPNTIAYNGATTGQGGVFLTTSNAGTTSGISILSNSIFQNVGTPGGIQFSPSTVNNGQQPPLLTNQAGIGVGKTLVQGTFTGTSGQMYTLQFFDTPPVSGSDPRQGKTFLGSTQVTVDSTGQVSFNALLSTLATLGHNVTATATDSTGDTSEFSNAVVVARANLVDLVVKITPLPPETLGQPFTYTITVTNNSPGPATAVVLTDTLAASLGYQSATASGGGMVSVLGQVVTAKFPTIAAGGTATLSIVVNPTVTGNVTNTATVSSSDIDSNTLNNSASLTTAVNVPSDLSITATAAPNPQIIGQQFAYTIIVTNKGPGPATNATVKDALPAGLNVLSVSSGQGSTTQAGGLVTANLGTLPVGVSAAVRIVVSSSTPGSISNTVTVSSDESDPTPADNTYTVVSIVQPAADLILTGSASPSPVLSGNKLTYTLNVLNGGPSPATGINLTDLLPANSVFVSATTSQGTFAVNNGLLTANLGNLDASATATVTIVVVPTVSEVIQDGATVSGNEPDQNTKSNTITISTAVSPVDVAVSIAADPSTPLIGQYTTLDVTVTNNGPAAASNVVLTDILPSNATYVGAAPPQGILSVAGNTLIVQFGSIAAGASVVVPIVVIPDSSGTLVDSASVTNPEYDPDRANNSATLSALVSPAELVVSASSSAPTLLLGGQVTYTANVTNDGPAVATNVVLSNPVPAGFQFISATTTAGSIVGTGSTVYAAIGTLAVGASAQVTFVYQPLATGTVSNVFVANADQADPNPSNSVATLSTTVTNLPGTFNLSASSYSVSESAGSATIVINRSGGSRGAASVFVSTAGGSAVPGFDYTSIAQTVNFADGQTSATVTIPILDNGVTQPNTTVGITLTGASGGATIGTQSGAILTIINTHPDVSGPQVLGIILNGGARSIPSMQIGFTKPLDPSTATNIANYTVTAPNGRVQPISSAVYNPTTNIVTLTFSRALPSGRFYQLVVNGSGPGAIVDSSTGSVLDGDGNGTAGGNFVATFDRAPTIKYADATGNIVTFRLQKGGYLDLIRSASGNGMALTISGARPYRTILSGTVRPAGPSATGVTTLQAIYGLDPFGAIKSTLTSPPFVVGNSPTLSSASLIAEALANPDDLFPASLKKKHG